MMRQKMFAIGQDFFIEGESCSKVFKVDGKVLRVRYTLFFRDLSGKELRKLQQKVAEVSSSGSVCEILTA